MLEPDSDNLIESDDLIISCLIFIIHTLRPDEIFWAALGAVWVVIVSVGVFVKLLYRYLKWRLRRLEARESR